jgi:PAS domain S-box-containing protein
MALEGDMKGPEHDRTEPVEGPEVESGSNGRSREPAPIPQVDASELFQAAFRASPDSVNINRLDDGMYVDANEGFAAITGWTREEVIGQTSLEINVWADPEDRVRMVEGLSRAGRVENLEARFRMRDGGVRWGLMSARILSIGGVPHILSITRDITDRREAEERVRESQARLNAVVSAAPIVLWALDREGRFTLSEGLGLESIGLQPGEAVGRFVHELYGAYPMILADIRAAMQGQSLTASHQVADRVFQSRLVPRFSDDGAVTGILGVSLDVTQEAELQAQLLQAQKLEAVGRLAGGVAHDFNNLLTAIQGYAELLAERLRKPLPEDPEALVEIRQDLEEIRRAAERASSLTAQLLAFSRKQVLEKTVLDLNHQVGQVDRMLRRLIGEDIVLSTELAPDLQHVEADPSQLEQVIVNLAVNARDAMPSGGRLTLSTRNANISEPVSGEHGEIPPGSYIVLSVADSGSGIPPEDRPHIFEPFFTTKAQGKGTGLGLPTVFGIVTQSGGHVVVDSEVGRGTTFELWLPATTEAVPEGAVRTFPNAALGEETVLLAEDDDAVRGFVSQVLTRSGYRVLEAADARSAAALSREWNDPIHLLITDVVMPEMGGRDLARLLEEERPGLPALFISGYAGEVGAWEGFPRPGQGFLPKPFSPGALTQKVRRMLDSATDSVTPD